VAVRDKVARDLFEDLLEDEKAQWIEQAKEDYEVAVARWKQETEGNPSIAPEDRQRSVPASFLLFTMINFCTDVSRDSFVSRNRSWTLFARQLAGSARSSQVGQNQCMVVD